MGSVCDGKTTQGGRLGRQPIDGGLLLMASKLLTSFAVGLREANAVVRVQTIPATRYKVLLDIRSATVGRPKRVAGDENLDTSSI